MAFEECPAGELAEAIGQMHAVMCAAHRQMLGLVAAFDAQEGWRVDGATSVVPWLVAALGARHSTAAAWARVAGQLEDLPAVAGAYGDGRLSADQLAPVLRMATPDNEVELVEAAVGWSAAQARAIARQAAPKAQPPERSTLRWWRDGEDADVLHLRGCLRGDTAVVVEQRLEEETARVPGDSVFEYKAAEALAGLCAARDKSEAGRAVDRSGSREQFRRSVAAGELRELPGQIVEVFCRCDANTARARYAARSGSRHPGHFDPMRVADDIWNDEVSEPVAGGWPVFEVDTSGSLEIEGVLAFLFQFTAAPGACCKR